MPVEFPSNSISLNKRNYLEMTSQFATITIKMLQVGMVGGSRDLGGHRIHRDRISVVCVCTERKILASARANQETRRSRRQGKKGDEDSQEGPRSPWPK